jgi:hypothetical protein
MHSKRVSKSFFRILHLLIKAVPYIINLHTLYLLVLANTRLNTKRSVFLLENTTSTSDTRVRSTAKWGFDFAMNDDSMAFEPLRRLRQWSSQFQLAQEGQPY